MTFNEKKETINNRIVQKETHYNLDRQNAKIAALSPANVDKLLKKNTKY